MLAIRGIAAAVAASATCARPAQDVGGAASAKILPAPGRALSVLEARPEGPLGAMAASSRPAAAFLAQLIATAQKAPQTRQRRRAEPAEARGAYAAAATPSLWIGGAIYRSL